MESKRDLINKDRMKRIVICINPNHETIRFESNEQIVKCPLCDNVMVTEVKSVVKIDELAK